MSKTVTSRKPWCRSASAVASPHGPAPTTATRKGGSAEAEAEAEAEAAEEEVPRREGPAREEDAAGTRERDPRRPPGRDPAGTTCRRAAMSG